MLNYNITLNVKMKINAEKILLEKDFDLKKNIFFVSGNEETLINKVKTQLNNSKNNRSNNKKLFLSYIKQINKYSVELHKKFSIPIACFIFILLGTPLGIMSKNRNMSVSISISIIFFIIYWSFLILGEDLADRGRLNPAVSMWAPNIFLGLLSYYLYRIVSRENVSFSIDLNLLKYFKKK